MRPIRSTSIKSNILAGAALLTIGSPMLIAPAFAQESARADSQPFSDIIVTATRRETTLQTTALSVSAVGADELLAQQANNVTDLSRLAPSLFVQGASTQENSISLRGVSSARQGPLQDLPVAQYLDGVYLPGPYGQIFSFPDVERIEVLRGPQGVLSGRNATGGAINVITRDPTDTFQGQALFRYASFDAYDIQASASGPITDKLSFKVGGVIHHNPGWQRLQATTNQPAFAKAPRANGDSSTTFDIGLRLKATDNWTIDLRGDRSKSDIPYLNRVLDTSPGWAATRFGLTQCDMSCNRIWTEVLNRFATSENKGVNLTNKIDLGFADLKSITAYRMSETQIFNDSDGTDIPSSNAYQDSIFRQFSQEIVLASSGDGPFHWVTGAFYLHQKVTNQGSVSLPVNNTNPALGPTGVGTSTVLASGAQSKSTVNGDSYSVFGNLSYDLTSRLTVELGGRYTHEAKDFQRVTVATGVPQTFTYVNGGPAFTQLKVKQDVFTPRASMSYKITDDNFLYATVSKGTKAPGFNFGGAVNSAVTFKPEYVTSYEAGIKNSFFDKQLRLNLTAFHSDYKNYQLGFPIGGGIASLIGGTARITGQELEMSFRPRALSGLELSGSVSHLNARLKDFTVPIGIYSDNPLNATTAQRQAAAAAQCQPAFLQSNFDCKLNGNRMPLSPEWSINGTVSYRADLGSAGKWTPRVDVQHASRTYYTAFQVKEQGTNAFTVVNASLAWEPEGSNFRFSAFARNLFNERHVEYAILSSFNRSLAPAAAGTPLQGPGANQNVLVGKVNRPVSYGAEISFKF